LQQVKKKSTEEPFCQTFGKKMETTVDLFPTDDKKERETGREEGVDISANLSGVTVPAAQTITPATSNWQKMALGEL
jgi:hypothetical protein